MSARKRSFITEACDAQVPFTGELGARAIVCYLKCFAGLAIFLRWKDVLASEAGRYLNRAALAAVAFYAAALFTLSYAVRRFALGELQAQGIEVEDLMAGPRPMTPFLKDVVAATPEDYRYHFAAETSASAPQLIISSKSMMRFLRAKRMVSRALSFE